MKTLAMLRLQGRTLGNWPCWFAATILLFMVFTSLSVFYFVDILPLNKQLQAATTHHADLQLYLAQTNTLSTPSLQDLFHLAQKSGLQSCELKPGPRQITLSAYGQYVTLLAFLSALPPQWHLLALSITKKTPNTPNIHLQLSV